MDIVYLVTCDQRSFESANQMIEQGKTSGELPSTLVIKVFNNLDEVFERFRYYEHDSSSAQIFRQKQPLRLVIGWDLELYPAMETVVEDSVIRLKASTLPNLELLRISYWGLRPILRQLSHRLEEMNHKLQPSAA